MNIFNKLKNSISQYPKVFFARHIGEGVVSYKNTDGGEDIFFIGNDTLKKMNASFTGKPVYIQHQEVPLSQMKERAVGYVVESFYLPEDGKQWLKMLITDDEAFEAIQNGWKVSNAYNVKDLGAGGVWHNIPYKREILDGEYEHLALVADPRYEEAVIMTPEDFKSYKEAKKKELDAMSLDNSKKAVIKKSVENNKERKTMFQFFTKKKVENMDGVALQDVEVQLENGSSMKIGDIVKSVEENLKKQATETPIEEKKVMVNGKEVTISALIKMYNEQEKAESEKDEEGKDGEEGKEADKTDKTDKTDKANEADEDKTDKTDKRKLIEEVGGFLKENGLSDEAIRFVIGKMENDAYEKDEGGKDNGKGGKKANEADPDKKDEKSNCDPAKKTNEDDKDKKDDKDKEGDKDADKKTNSKESDFDRLLNAVGSFKAKESVVETLETRLERGQDLYGSEK